MTLLRRQGSSTTTLRPAPGMWNTRRIIHNGGMAEEPVIPVVSPRHPQSTAPITTTNQ